MKARQPLLIIILAGLMLWSTNILGKAEANTPGGSGKPPASKYEVVGSGWDFIVRTAKLWWYLV